MAAQVKGSAAGQAVSSDPERKATLRREEGPRGCCWALTAAGGHTVNAEAASENAGEESDPALLQRGGRTRGEGQPRPLPERGSGPAVCAG